MRCCGRSGQAGLALLGLRIPISFFRHTVISSVALWRAVVAERLDEHAIIHCNDLETLLVGVMARRAFGCKVVYDCHEFLPHAWPDATRWNRWLMGRYEGWLIRFADSVIHGQPLARRRDHEGLPRHRGAVGAQRRTAA